MTAGHDSAAGRRPALSVLAGLMLLTGGALAGPALAQAPAPAGENQFFRIGTGEIDGPAFTVAGVVAGGLSNPPGGRPCDRGGSCGVPGMIAVAQAIGDPASAIDLVVRGQIEATLLPADQALRVYVNRQGRNGEARGLLRSVGTVFVEPLQIVVLADAGKADLAGLRGEPIVIAGTDGSGLRLARQALAHLGLKLPPQSDAIPPLPAALELLSEGRVDAVATVGAAPVAGLAEFARTVPIRLLDMPQDVAQALSSDYRYLVSGTIAGGTYRGSNQAEVLALPTQLFVSADADAQLIYQVTRALWNEASQRLFAAGSPETRDSRPDRAVAGLVVPLHPGAARFYREAGLLQAVAPAETTPAGPPLRMRTELVRPALRTPG